MSGPQDEIPPPPPPPPSSSQTPTQPTPHTVSTIKLPILKRRIGYLAMKMEHSLASTRLSNLEFIQNGNGPIHHYSINSGNKDGSRTVQERRLPKALVTIDGEGDVLTYHKKLLAEAQKEKEDLKAKVEKWHNSSKNLSKLLNTQMSANDNVLGLEYGD
ncbi:hypothetical protein Tco_1378397 [Tanacetum coccineum]